MDGPVWDVVEGQTPFSYKKNDVGSMAGSLPYGECAQRAL